MATLRLESADRNILDLPDVCMQCGAPATLRKRKTFSWFPPWIWILLFVCGLLPFAIVALIMTKRRTIETPLCDEHKNYWFTRQLLVLGSFAGVFAVGFLAWVLVMEDDGRNDNPLGGILCIGSLIALVAWVILAVIVQSTSVRAREITNSDITLVGVSKAFVEAYDQQWHVAPELLDDLAREHWNQSRRSPSARRPVEEDSDRIQQAEEDEKRRSLPPDTFQEGPS
jgi:hypothetical protein